MNDYELDFYKELAARRGEERNEWRRVAGKLKSERDHWRNAFEALCKVVERWTGESFRVGADESEADQDPELHQTR